MIHVLVVRSVLDSIETLVGIAVIVDVMMIESPDPALLIKVVDESSVEVGTNEELVSSSISDEVNDANVVGKVSFVEVDADAVPEVSDDGFKVDVSMRSSKEVVSDEELVEIRVRELSGTATGVELVEDDGRSDSLVVERMVEEKTP